MAYTDELKVKRINYEIFVIMLTVLSWINTFLFFRQVDDNGRFIIVWIECILAFFFFIDFLYRLKIVKSRSQYFRKYGWMDLIGSIPFLQWFRAYRVYKTTQYIRKEQGQVFRGFFQARAETAVLTVTLAIIFLFEFASLAILNAEELATNANITTAGDAIWWVLVTVATVGYGDKYPVTKDGRIIASFVIVAGVGLFSILSGFLARNFLGGQSISGNSSTESTKIVTEVDPHLEEILIELKELRSQNEEARKRQEMANQVLQERIVAVEALLKSKKTEG